MDKSLNKKVLSAILCICFVLSMLTGCAKDEYYWLSDYETKEVPVTVTVDDEEPTYERVYINSDDEPDSAETDIDGDSDNSQTNESGSGNTSDDSASKPSKAIYNPKATVDSADKPKVKNTACLITPITSKSDSQSETLRTKILNTKDVSHSVKGTKYYISYKGDDSNDGLSPKSAWKTLKKLANSLQVGNGDAVYFERGGVYRGSISARTGVFYGAFGKGDKPCIYGSSNNYAKVNWSSEGKNIWKCSSSLTDAGIIVFNHGELAGKRKFKLSDLKSNGDYYSQNDGKLYLYMNKNPSSKYKSIEIGCDKHIISIPSNTENVIIDNLTLKYTGAMGVQAATKVKDITVTNCEIGWCGGSCLNGYGDGTVRYGNGIEFWQQCENIKVQNCWIYQIYDSGFSHQGNSGKFTVKNVLVNNCLIEYTGFGAIEYWAPAENAHKMIDIEYSENILRFGGYCWDYSGQPAALLYSTDNYNDFDNFVIKNNIFDTSKKNMIRCIHQCGKVPVLSGNTYIGKTGDKLGLFGTSLTDQTLLLGSSSSDDIKTIWNDNSPNVLFN